MRSVPLGVVVALALQTAAATAQQTPAPHPSRSPHAATASPHPAPFMTFGNPATSGKQSHVQTGAGCNQQTQIQARNPITGQPQAQTFVSVPLTKGSGSVASATTRAQQQQICAQGR